MSELDYTESEHRLLCQYDLLKDIKEGRRKLIAPPRQQKQQQQQQTKSTTAAPPATAGQKLPSRIRLKAVTKSAATGSEQPGSPLPPSSPQSTHPLPAGAPTGGAPTGVVAKPSLEAPTPVTAEQPVQATVSRAQLAALLRQKQEQQAPQAEAAGAGEAAGQHISAAAVEPSAGQPADRLTPTVARPLQKAAQVSHQTMAEEQQAPASRSAPAQEDDIDYDAVSSPEYDVDYGAVSSPEYEVSGRTSAEAAADHAEAKQDARLLTLTPDRQDSRMSSERSRPSPNQASRHSRPDHSAARRRSRSRSRSPSSSGSRSPARGPRSRDGRRGYSGGRCRSWRRNSRSRSRNRSPRGIRRRSSPDYGLGAGPGAAGRQQAQSLSRSRSPSPDVRRRSRTKSQQHSKQKHPTLFVGDLPPAGFASEDLHGLFAAYGWSIISARVQGSQCYGFVEFENKVDAEEALHLMEIKDEGFIVNGVSIRASWAKGTMPNWKKGKAVLTPRDRSVGLEGLEAYEHPTARLIRLQAAAVAAMNGLAVPVPVSDVVDAAGGAAGDGHLPGAQTAGRQLMDYGDL